LTESLKLVAKNRRAFHEYHIEERFEAGVVLVGSEVKSLRVGKLSLADAWIDEREGELFLVDAHISTYVYANLRNHDPVRPRKLLLHAKEIDRIVKRVREKGFTAIPLSVYFKEGRAKVELALAKGKKLHDKREDIKKKDQGREMQRQLRNRGES